MFERYDACRLLTTVMMILTVRRSTVFRLLLSDA